MMQTIAILFPGTSIVQKFAVESDFYKRRWIQSTCPEIQSLFADVQHLAKERAIDDKKFPPKLSDVTRVMFWIAGLSCKSVSRLNATRASF
jgi:hypothetical protein